MVANTITKAPWTPPSSDPLIDAVPIKAPWTPPDPLVDHKESWAPPVEDEILGTLRTKTADQLYADKTFRPDISLATVGAHNLTPEDIDKLTDVYKRQMSDGFDWSRVPAEVITHAPGVVGDMIMGAGGVVKRGLTLLSDSKSASHVDKTKAGAEFLASLEAGSTATAGLIKSGARKIGDVIHGTPSDEEFKNRLFEAAASHEQQQKLYKGEGEISKAAGLAEASNAVGMPLDEEAITRMSNVTDPTMLLPVGAGWKVLESATGKVLFSAATREAAAAFSKTLGEKLVVAGKGISTVGKGLGTLRGGNFGALAGLAAGHAIPGAVTGVAIPAGIRATGKIVEGVGNTLVKGPGPVLRLAGAGAKGGAAGLVTSLPFAAAADYEEDAANIAGAGIALGAGAGAAHKVVNDAVHATATRAFSEAAAPKTPIPDAPAIGTVPEYDVAHQQSMEMLEGVDPATANIVKRIRTVLPAMAEAANPNAPRPEVYLMEDSIYQDVFKGKPEEKQEGFFDPATNRVVFRLDGSNVEALHHEPSHILFDLFPEQQKQVVFSEIKKAYGEKGIEQFTKQYEDWFNSKLPPEQHKFFGEIYILTEIATEHLSAILRGDKLDGTSPSVIKGLGRDATRLFELLGLYKPEIGGTPNKSTVTKLRVGVSPAVADLLSPFFNEHMRSPEVADALKGTPPPAPVKEPWTPPASDPLINATPEKPAQVPTQPGLATPAPAELFEQPKPSSTSQGNPPPGLATEPPDPAVFGGFSDRPFVAPQPEKATPPDVHTPPLEPTVRAGEIEAAQKPENIRGVTDEQITKLSTERDDMNIAPAAEAVKNASPEEQKVFSDIVTALQGSTRGNTPLLEVVHRSITPTEEASPTHRTTRRTEQEAGRAAEAEGSTTERTEATKRIVPTGFSVTEDGRAQLFGQSADKVLAAVNSGLVREANDHAISEKVPYENKNGVLTPEGEAQFLQDLGAYTANQANGYRGDGKRLVRPANYDGILPAENSTFKPIALAEDRTNFLNMVVAGGEMIYPKTNRVQKNSLTGAPIKPRNIAARELAEANVRPALEPGKPGPKNQTYADFGGTKIAEFNPLRQEFEKAGIDVRKKFIGSPETLNLSDIVSVKPLPGRAFQAPSIDIVRAGFMPKTGDEKTEAHFMPAKTEAGKKLEKEGYRFRHVGEKGHRQVEIWNGDDAVGWLTLAPTRAKNAAEVEMVKVLPKYRGKKLSEVLYREAATLLQKDGVTRLRGLVVAPQPLAARRNVFGNLDNIQVSALADGKRVRIKLNQTEAAELLNSVNGQIDAGEDVAMPAVHVENGIDPAARFMPKTGGEKVSEAAVRVDGKHVFTGRFHPEAALKAIEAGVIKESELKGGRVEDGFVSDKGRYLSREEAFKLARDGKPGEGRLDAGDLIPTEEGTAVEDDKKFMPREASVESADDVRKLSTQDFAHAAQQWKGGLTGQAIELGKRSTTADIPVLEGFWGEAKEKLGEYRAARNFEGAMTEASRGQFYREAIESIRAANGEKGLSIRPEDVNESPRAFMPDARTNRRQSNEDVRKVASDYMKSIGREYKPDTNYVPVNVDFAKRVADYYDEAKRRWGRT